jgi:hypothetical protein
MDGFIRGCAPMKQNAKCSTRLRNGGQASNIPERIWGRPIYINRPALNGSEGGGGNPELTSQQAGLSLRVVQLAGRQVLGWQPAPRRMRRATSAIARMHRSRATGATRSPPGIGPLWRRRCPHAAGRHRYPDALRSVIREIRLIRGYSENLRKSVDKNAHFVLTRVRVAIC